MVVRTGSPPPDDGERVRRYVDALKVSPAAEIRGGDRYKPGGTASPEIVARYKERQRRKDAKRKAMRARRKAMAAKLQG
jgi:hypothetical protein